MLNFWQNKKVLITGDSGFKGSWLTCLLLKLGSNVTGISLKPDSSNLLYKHLSEDIEFKNFLNKNIYNHHDVDIRENQNLKNIVKEIQPDVIFHLAAQPLVRESYISPDITWETNVMGTINLLEAIRLLKSCSVVIVTTDKVYENYSWEYSYRENDKLGGYDPYSSSKSAVELAVKSWRKSFLNNNDIKISTARAGNVIGGGDWAVDRLVPDIINSLIKRKTLTLRYPNAVRPWQHVLDPLWGYIKLAELQLLKKTSSEYNFGPFIKEVNSVENLVNKISNEWGEKINIETIDNQPSESRFLTLAIDKALNELDWKPAWGLDKTIYETVKWYKNVNAGESAYKNILDNIESFFKDKKLYS